MDKKEIGILTICILQIIFSATAIANFNLFNVAWSVAGIVPLISLILSVIILVYTIGILQAKKSAVKGFICTAYAIVAIEVIRNAYLLVKIYPAAIAQVGIGTYLLLILQQLLPLAVTVVFYSFAIMLLRKR